MAKVELVGTQEDFVPETGNFFMEKDSHEIYILTKVSDDGYILICLNDGHRWSHIQNDPSKVFNGDKKSFVKIRAPFTITPE